MRVQANTSPGAVAAALGVGRVRRGIARKLAIPTLALWSFVQVIAAVQTGEVDSGRTAVVVKLLIGPACAIVIWVGNPTVIGVRSFLPLIAFSGYAALNAAVRSSPEYLAAGLYAGWAFVVFVASPAAFPDREAVLRFIRVNTMGILVAVALAYLYLGSRGESIEWIGSTDERVRYGFGMNPAYFGKVAAALAVNALILAAHSMTRRRLVTFLLAGLGVWLTVLTSTRTMMALVAAFVATLVWSKGRGWKVVAIVAGLIGIGVTVMSAVSRGPAEGSGLNAWSSGRWDIWQMIVSYNLDDAAAVVFGNGRTRWPGSSWPDGILTMAHVDNLYLDVLCSSGIIGLGLIVLGFASWWRRANARPDAGRFVSAILAAVLLAGITDSLLPSLGNLINSDLLLIAVGFTVTARRPPSVAEGMRV